MRVINIYLNDLAPGVAPINDVTTIESVTVDGEPAIRVTTSGGTVYTTKRSVAQPVIQWD